MGVGALVIWTALMILAIVIFIELKERY